MAQAREIPQEYETEIVDYLKGLIFGEMWAGDVAGYWQRYVPSDPDLFELRFELSKMAYDEQRHANICDRMVQHFGGQEAVDEMYRNLRESDRLATRDEIYTTGIKDLPEYLCTLPLLADMTGIYYFADVAENSPDQLWADAAESISQDERLHGSISAEFLPIIVEKDDDAIESIDRGLRRWTLPMFAIAGTPESSKKQELIERGVVSLDNRFLLQKQIEQLEEVISPLPVDFEVPTLEELETGKGPLDIEIPEEAEYGDQLLRGEQAQQFELKVAEPPIGEAMAPEKALRKVKGW